MVLIANCFIDDRFADSFDRALAMRTKKEGFEQFSIRLKELNGMDLADLETFAYLIISGSEASAMEVNPWDMTLKKMITSFIHAQKPVLGICYGHQFLAGMLAGVEYLRKRSRPEAGWARIETESNLIFEGLSTLVCMVSHYDEVHPLPENFQIIARTSDCQVGGFQYKNLPVWGLQFHPEYGMNDANLIFAELAKEDRSYNECVQKNMKNQIFTEEQLKQNEYIFHNFFRAKVEVTRF